MFKYKVDDRINAIVLDLIKDLNSDDFFKEFIPNAQKIINKTDPDKSMNRIYNFSSYKIDLTNEEMLKFLKMVKVLTDSYDKLKVAFVANNDLTFGEARVFNVYANNENKNVHRQVFKKLKDAEIWISKSE